MDGRANVIFVFADQHRASSMGYLGVEDVKTPNFDSFKKESVYFENAVSNCPVCSPYRASLMTGQYPLTHGVFVNDVHLEESNYSIANIYKRAGYDTAYIGKWHINGRGRSSFIPKENRQGFDYWKVLECTHDYNNSFYYANEDVKKKWDGYDVIAQTTDAIEYLDNKKTDKPVFMMLSYGPPHAPYETAPKKYQDMYKDTKIKLKENVPDEAYEKATRDIKGYYAHISAIDHEFARIVKYLKDNNMYENTILIYTSDHGDMLYSHNMTKKQKPYDEAIKVPFLLSYPRYFSKKEKKITKPFSAVDIMPTLLELCDLEIPDTVEGISYKDFLIGKDELDNVNEALIMNVHPFGQCNVYNGGYEFRGLRTEEYTYFRRLDGKDFLYDNVEDPNQLNDVSKDESYKDIMIDLKNRLDNLLLKNGDEFKPGMEYIGKWNYKVDNTLTVPYSD